MEWLLVVLIYWTVPHQVIQMPVATEDLCEAAAQQIVEDFKEEQNPTVRVKTSCIKVRS